MFDTLISPGVLVTRLEQPEWIVVDCRMDLMRPDLGRTEYEAAHIPGAVYAHLDRDLSGPPITNRGRHPLLTPEAMRATFGRLGIDDAIQVVAYDASGGSIAARLWWMLQYMGHAAAAVLDGGWPAWIAAAYPVEPGTRVNQPRVHAGHPREEWILNLEDVPYAPLLIDARDPARFRGEAEPIDSKAGHIPGAINHFWKNNLDAAGAFLAPAELRARLAPTLAGLPADAAASYCGSGVTACHNILAMKHAGLGMPRLYGGSWSEWCQSDARAVATGAS